MNRLFLAGLALALHAAGGDVPRRIVSLSPNMTELLYAIGALDHVVGVSEYTTWPPQATKLPRVGGWHNPSLEAVAARHPDLVIVDDGQAPFVEDDFQKLGLRLLTIPDRTVEDVYNAMVILGSATGHQEEAARLVASTRGALLRISQQTAHLAKPRVVLIVNRTPGTLRDLYTATEGSFLAELVGIAGGRIAVPRAKRGYAKLSKEDLLAIDPDFILDFIHGEQGRFGGEPLEAWSELPELKAVRTGRIRCVNEDFVPHASQRMVQTAEYFARIIHPEVR